MDDLIEALQIFRKYGNPGYLTHCEHDVMMVCGIRVLDVSDEDRARLKELGFTPGYEGDEYDEEKEEYVVTEDSETWSSFKFGSC